MILSDYSYFLRIVKTGSITKAAESLFISQPSLTKYLHKLEDELGVTLFDRTHFPLKLTDAGECFYEFVMHSEAEQRTLISKIEEIKNDERATITIGMPLWRSSVILPAFLPHFYQRHPLVTIKLVEGSAARLENALRNDEVNFCIMNLPLDYKDISYISLGEEYIYLIGSKKMRLVQRIDSMTQGKEPCTIDIHQFCDQPFVMTQPDQHITNFVNAMLNQNNIDLHCKIRTSNVTTAINLAASGIGFTFVPELGTLSQYFPREQVSMYLVNNPPLTCTIAGVYKRSSYLSRASRLFLGELKEFFKALEKK